MSVVLIAGSRKLVGQPFYDYMYEFVSKFPKNTVFLSGMADGVDIYGYRAAKVLGHRVKEMPIEDWEWKDDVHARRAGLVRDYCLGIYVQKSKDGYAHLFINNGHLTAGTKLMKEICEELLVPYTLHNCTFSPDELKQRVTNWRK